MIVLNDLTFSDATEKGVVLVKVEASWCGPCKMMKPMLSKLENEYTHVKFCSIDCDDEGSVNTITELGVRTVPTIIIYVNGVLTETQIGMKTETEMREILDKYAANEFTYVGKSNPC